MKNWSVKMTEDNKQNVTAERFNPKLFEYDKHTEYKWQVFKKVTIGIVTFNRVNLTQQLIESLIKYTHLPYNLIIVDNASTDETIPYLRSLAMNYDHIRLIENSKNKGLGRAHMQIRDELDEGLFVFFDNDIEILTNYWLMHLQKAYYAYMLANGDLNVAIGIPLVNMGEYGFRFAKNRKILTIATKDNSLPRSSYAAASKDCRNDKLILDEEVVMAETEYLVGGAFSCVASTFKSIPYEDYYPSLIGGTDGFCTAALIKQGQSLLYVENGPIARHNDWPYSDEKIVQYEASINQRAVTDWNYFKWKIRKVMSR